MDESFIIISSESPETSIIRHDALLDSMSEENQDTIVVTVQTSPNDTTNMSPIESISSSAIGSPRNNVKNDQTTRSANKTEVIKSFSNKMSSIIDYAKTSNDNNCIKDLIKSNQAAVNESSGIDSKDMSNLVKVLARKTGTFVENAKLNNDILTTVAAVSIDEARETYNYNQDFDFKNIKEDNISFKLINQTKHEVMGQLVEKNENDVHTILNNLKANKKHFLEAIFD